MWWEGDSEKEICLNKMTLDNRKKILLRFKMVTPHQKKWDCSFPCFCAQERRSKVVPVEG